MKILQVISKQSHHGKLPYLAAITAIVGMSLLIFSIQLYYDWQEISQKEGSYVVVNKPVNLLSTLGVKASFTNKEIEELEEVPFIKKVGAFTSNDFGVSMGSSSLGFRTDAFFEAVPDDFVDIEHDNWHHYQAGDEIPIILSSDYLALYNFGFAPSQGLPQFTASTISAVKIDVWIRGQRQMGTYKGRIIGFSKRLNSIIVPQSFLNYANKKYGSHSGTTSRLILEVENPDSPSLLSLVEDKDYEMNSNQAFGKQTSVIVHRTIGLISLIGFLVLLLTLIVFYLTYKLIVEEHTTNIQVLFTQGYLPQQISRHFSRRFLGLILLSILVATILVQVSHIFIAQILQNAGFNISTLLHPFTWVFIIALTIILLVLGKWVIRKHILSKFR